MRIPHPATAEILQPVLAIETITYGCFRNRIFYDDEHFNEYPLHTPSLEPLARLTALRSLDVSHSDAVDLSPLASLPRLEHLLTSSLQDLTPLRDLSSLHTLECGSHPRSDARLVSVLPHMRQLERLVVHGTFTVVPHLAKMTWLQALELSDTFNGGRSGCRSLSFVRGMQHLRRLECSYTHITSLAPLARVTNLEWLRARRTRITSLAPLANLKNLRELDISESPVSSLAPLENCGLQRLACYLTAIAPDEAAAWRARHPDCDTTWF